MDYSLFFSCLLLLLLSSSSHSLPLDYPGECCGPKTLDRNEGGLDMDADQIDIFTDVCGHLARNECLENSDCYWTCSGNDVYNSDRTHVVRH